MKGRAFRGAIATALTVLSVPLVTTAGFSATSSGSSTYSKVISRVDLDNGKDVVVDKRTFSVTVSSTAGLRDRQDLRVSWSGAHPTGFAVADPNSGLAAHQEYPVVLLECRGVDSASVPLSQRVRPETCWTQTPAERFFFSPGEAFPPWREDRYAAASDRVAVADRPTPIPPPCFDTGYTEHWLHFVAASGRDYPGGLGACDGHQAAPETSLVDSNLAMPGNTTYGATAADGKGSARFVVWTSQTNASLGCSDTVACSLVVVPIEGISCDVASLSLSVDERPTGDDATQAQQSCEATSGATVPSVTTMGELWWSASNWRNRITVPLHFNPLPSDCTGSSRTGISVYGSELLLQATQSWSAEFCRSSSLFPFKHVQVGEPFARNLLASGSITSAFTTLPPGPENSVPHVVAPTALTGFAVGYQIDDGKGQEYRKLRLTPRLLAKLLTMSYPAVTAVQQEAGQGTPPKDAPLDTNPLDMTRDPEFRALNPDIPEGVVAGPSAATLFSLSSDSDVIYALTSYINADPEARAWLNGNPDPWGMRVNKAYQGIALPTVSWPLLDTFEPLGIYNDNNLCLKNNPVPYLPLVAAPTNRLANISLALQFAIAPSQLICQLAPSGDIGGAKLVPLGRQQIGFRFLIGITSLGDAARYDIDEAALQTRVASNAPSAFTDASGRSFVGPSDASLKAAGDLLRADESSGSWSLPWSSVVGSAGSISAYPGTMLVSTAVPTQGLDATTAHHYAAFLRWVVGPGQVPGIQPGQLPTGFLPLTASNGLGALASYTLVAANAVAAQQGGAPSVTGGTSVPPPETVPAAHAGPPSVAPPVPVPVTNPVPVPSSGPSVPAPSLAPQVPAVASATFAPGAGAAGLALPVLAVVALASGLASALAHRLGPKTRA